MENILSKEEVSALLSGIAAGNVPLKPSASHAGRVEHVKPYDFAAGEEAPYGRIDVLDRLAARLRATLSSAVRQGAAVEAEALELTYEDFLKVCPVAMSFHPLDAAPSGKKGLLALDLDLVSTLIELFMGGSASKVKKIEGRGFTALENRLIKRVVDLVLQDVCGVLGQRGAVELERLECRGPVRLHGLMAPHEPVLHARADVDLGPSGGRVHLCLPLFVLKAAGEELAPAAGLNVGEMMDRLGESPVTLSVELMGSITLRETMNLRAGDLLPLESCAAAPVEVRVEGVPKLRATPGRVNGNWAVMVDGSICRGTMD